ncbi:MAG: efflux RND transporter periplasmic adaptor subunit [Bacteroidales bacterium]|nr:efflux RND transporter periplasmic adaptor subunit [Bacteroidales bacterium]
MKLIYLGLLFSLLFISCSDNTEKKETVRPVFYQKISETNIAGKRSFAGISQAENEARLSFKVGGILEKIHFKLGEHVKKGAVLAHLNSIDYKINYDKAMAAKKNADVQLTSAKSAYLRVEKLYASNNASLSDFEKAKAQFESAKAMVNTAQSQLNAARNQLNYTKLLAPFDGSISKIMAKENEMIGAGMPVLIFSSNDAIEIRTQVPENVIRLINIGKNVSLVFSSIADKTFKGEISEISRSTGRTSTYTVIIKLLDKSDKILPGMACTIEMTFDEGKNTNQFIIVPADAVAHDEGGDFVYTIINSDEKGIYIAKRRNVILGELTATGYEIKEGLNTDDIIITAGLSFMYDGRKVKLLEEK